MDRSDEAIPEVIDHADGKVKYQDACLEAEMHGAWEFFRKDGSMMRRAAFERGQRVGIWRTCDGRASSWRAFVGLRHRDHRPTGADELRQRLQQRGIAPASEIITYCTIGNRASRARFALSVLLGDANAGVKPSRA